VCSLALGSSPVSPDQPIRVGMNRRNTAVVMINMRREVLTMLKSWERRELIISLEELGITDTRVRRAQTGCWKF